MSSVKRAIGNTRKGLGCWPSDQPAGGGGAGICSGKMRGDAAKTVFGRALCRAGGGECGGGRGRATPPPCGRGIKPKMECGLRLELRLRLVAVKKRLGFDLHCGTQQASPAGGKFQRVRDQSLA